MSRTDKMVPIEFNVEHIDAICTALDIDYDSFYHRKEGQFPADVLEAIVDLQECIRELMQRCCCVIEGNQIVEHCKLHGEIESGLKAKIEALEERVEEQLGEIESYKMDDPHTELLELLERVKDLEHPWVSVDERLPSSRGMYFVKCGYTSQFNEEFSTPHKVAAFAGGMFLNSAVAYWMPIPPREE